MDTENPFAQQTFQPAPMFTDDQKVTDQSAEPSPKRKSRRSRRTAAAASPASPAPVKRKYTRRKPATIITVSQAKADRQLPIAAPAPKALLSPELEDTETVVRVTAKIIDELRLLSPAIRKQVWTGIGRLL